MGEAMFEMFAGKSKHDCNLAKRWEAYGVKSKFDENKMELDIQLPSGWKNTMSPMDHKAVSNAWAEDIADVDWCDDVAYEIHLDRDTHTYRIDKLVAEMLDEDGLIEFSTPLTFEFIEAALPKTTIDVQLVAKVKTTKGDTKTIKLVEGTLTIPDEPAAIGNNTAGVFVIVAGGFALFAHYDIGTPGRITHFAFMGKIAGLKKEYATLG